MAIRKILTLEKPVLRAKAKRVTRFDAHLQRLLDDMWETLREAPGVGLAGPQIGESIRVLVAEYEDQQVAFVNPEIVKRSEELVLGTEGCLSIPGYVGDDVPRSAAITVKGRDPKGKEIRVKAEGWYARILRSSLVEVLRQDYIRTARAKGLTERSVVIVHALRNALLPVVAMVGLDIGTFMGGAVVVESVYGWPGIGQLAWQAIQRLDIPIDLSQDDNVTSLNPGAHTPVGPNRQTPVV